METDTYLLYGNISPEDVHTAREILKSEDVYEVRMKSEDPDLTETLAVIVFVKFGIIDYEKGISLKQTLEADAERLYKITDYFRKTGRNNDYMSLDLFISSQDKLFSLLIVSESKVYELTLTLLDSQMETIATAANNGDCIKVMIDNDNKLEITNCSHLKDLYAVVKDSI